MDTWTSIKSGREALGDYLSMLTAEEWKTPWLCAGWTVKDVAGPHAGDSDDVERRGELLVHSADISEAIGKPFDLPITDYVADLEYLKGVQPVFGATKRIAGLKLESTDANWSTGTGPIVSGPSKQLLLALAGRRSALDKLTGEGLATLRSR